MARHWHDHEHHGLHDHEWHGRRGRRFFRSGELHLVLLALLAQRPQHGYDLMNELEVLFGPAYTPSPGSIYPALSGLEAEGLIRAEAEGDRKVFSVTEMGRRALVDRERVLAAVEARTGARLSGGALEPALNRLVARVRAVASKVDHAAVEVVLDEAGDRVEGLVGHGEAKEARQ
ncbi:MAG: PadR family transcriptional regulator [Actinobacteria bacterium]|nr:PadR family transcriptional regulator [Actinomycetota bacterium]